MKSKIAILTKIKKFEIYEENINRLKKNYVLIKVYKTGICGSDLHYYNHFGLGSFKQKNHISLGHESCGIIVDKNDTHFKNGDMVAIDPLNLSQCQNFDEKIYFCKKCNDQINLCSKGLYLGAMPQIGTFREYIPLHKSQITKINDKKVFENSNLFEPLGIAMYSVNVAKVNYEKKK